MQYKIILTNSHRKIIVAKFHTKVYADLSCSLYNELIEQQSSWFYLVIDYDCEGEYL